MDAKASSSLAKKFPGLAAFVDDVGIAIEDGDRELVLAQILPDVLDRIEFGSIRRQVQKGEVVRDVETVCDMPAAPVDD